MSDPDLRDFFKGSNKAKKYNDDLKKKKKQQTQIHQSPITPFSPTTMPPPVLWEVPQPPIDVVKNGNWPEWEWMGETFRPYYAGNLWLNRTASHVYWAYMDRDEYTITSIKSLDVKVDAYGKQYVETYIKGVKTTTYLDDALMTCFQTSLQPIQVSSPTPQNVVKPIPPQPSKRNRTIYSLDGEEFAFDHIERFCVSKKNGKAAYLSIDWVNKTHNPDKAIRYRVFTNNSGRLAVNVKQSDGTYKEIDMATVICRTFNGEPTISGMVVRFKDDNVGNCDADNLYWDMP